MDSATLEHPKKTARKGQFTAEAAREAGRKGAAALAANRLAEEKRIAAIEAENNLAKPIVDALKAVSSSEVLPTVQASPSYVLARLARTRAQLAQLDGQLEAAKEPRDVKAIADAIARLSEVERILAGRPAPGAYRPVREKAKRASAMESGPLDAEME